MKQNWEYKRLGDVCDIICGQDYKSVQDDNGPYPIYGTGGVMGYASQHRCPANSIIIGRKGSINNPLFVEEPFWNVDTAFGVVPNHHFLTPKYFFYFCRNYDFTQHDVAVTIPSLRRIDLVKIQVPIPPLEEQSRIVAELDLLTGIIDKQNAQLKELDNLAQAIFYDMFGDPIENPKGWEVKKLGELCNVGSSRRIFADEYVESGIPFYRSKEIIEKSKNKPISVELFIREDRYIELKKNNGVPAVGDLLITAVGTIGEIWVVDSEQPFYFKDGNIVWLSRMSPMVDSFFFRFSLEKIIVEYKKKATIGSAYAALTIVNLKKMDVLLPPLTLQQSFAEKIQSIERQKETIRTSIADTQKLLDYTMDKYFG